MNWSPEDVKLAIDRLRAKLGRKENSGLQEMFDAGLYPDLLSYGKLGQCMPTLPIIEKYLVGATSFLHQPSNYYDVFRACRCVKIVQVLDSALEILLAMGVAGLEQRLARLVAETTHDALDAVVYELVVAARYARLSAVRHLEFIDQHPGRKSPDFLVRVGGLDSCVECKKIDRAQDFTVATRNAVRDDLNAAIACFQKRGISALADVVYNCDPQQVNRAQLVAACDDALRERTNIIEADFNVKAIRLAPWRSDTYTLYPSPYFQWHRYGYRTRSEWFGVVNAMFASMCHQASLPARLRGGTSTWLNEIEWDAAVRWKVSAEDIVARYRRFGFDGVFKGIEQVKGAGPDSTVHLWLETEYYIGERRNAMVDLMRRIGGKAKDIFGWIIINETLLDVSPKGRFDMIEHAHFVRGPSATAREPLVSGVFIPDENGVNGPEFGLGAQLPDIDEDS